MSLTLVEKMQKKYHKTVDITDLKDMLYKSAKKYGNRPAFKLKDSIGNISKVMYRGKIIQNIKKMLLI